MKKHFISKTISLVLCAALVSGLLTVSEKASAADGQDLSAWRDSIALDFGIRGDGTGADLDSTLKFTEVETIPEVSELDSAALLKEGHGDYLYESTTAADIYEGASNAQHIGFDKVVPAAVTTEGGNYYKDWIFSPNGEQYKFSADLPAGQYYVYVYTGNKTRDYGNTTVVRFGNETVNDAPLTYNQTSGDSRQFYGGAENENKTDPDCVYVVDVKDGGEGYGTLEAYFSDDTIGNESYANSHQITVGSALEDIAAYVPADPENPDSEASGKVLGIDVFDFYEGTDHAIDTSAISDSVVTARLNGIEIIPVSNTVHATDIKTPESMLIDVGQAAALEVDSGAEAVTDRIAYISSNPEVASVDIYSGTVTGNAVGSAEIYAYNTYLGKLSTTAVTVIPERVVSLDKATISATLDGGSEYTAELTASFNAATEDIIEWSSSDENVASIGAAEFTPGDTATSKVTITIKNAGEATITAKRKDIDKSATCAVSARIPVTGIQVVNSSDNTPVNALSINVGSSADIKAIITPDNATVKDVSFVSSNSDIALVSVDGDVATIAGESEGTADITVSSKDNPEVSAVVTVTVIQPVTNTETPGTSQTPSAGAPDPSAQGQPQITGGTEKAAKASISLSGKKSSSLKVKKSVTFKAKAPGSKVKSIKVKVKSGKKLVKIKKSAKNIKITALKKGTAKLVITVKAASGASKKFNRTIKIK